MKNIRLNGVKISYIEISLFIGLIVAVVCCFSNVICQSEDMGNHIFRLHILAKSDSEEDQDLKLKVRDEVLQSFNFDDSKNDLEMAKNQVEGQLQNVEKVAKSAIEKAGYDYDVEPEIVNMYFNTREYGDFSIPAGMYDALRLKIGKAQGRNWWCVLVPSLCVPAADSTSGEKLEDVLNSEQQELIKTGSKSEVRFAVVELYEYLKSLFV